MNLAEDLCKRQIDQAAILPCAISKNAGWSITTQVTEWDFDCALRELVERLLRKDRIRGACNTAWSEPAPEFFWDDLDDRSIGDMHHVTR
jgi:hypothetical protein